jgi:diguanylate cyclase (GGDEF)-like protein
MSSQVGAARRRGLRRVEAASASGHQGGDAAVPVALATLTRDLATAESGLHFIYNLLDNLVEAGEWRDAAIVVDDGSLGRQVFRAGRRPPWEWPLRSLAELPAGLHTIPDHGDEELDVVVTNLSSVALQLDLLRHDASHDALTGLLNRRSFDDLLSQACSRSQRYGWPFGLALLDLDNFKVINDMLGHDGGDRVLRAIGTALHKSLRSGDIAARVGGDEFALILANSQLESVDTIVHRLRAALGGILQSEEAGFSVGVALAPEEATEVEELYRLADHRLYEAKRAR